MEREEIRERLIDLVDGTLPPEEARRVEAGIERYPDLAQELDDLREAVALAGKLSGVEVPPDLNEGIRRAVDDSVSARPPRIVPLWIFGLAAAAVLVLALGISILREFRNRDDVSSPDRQVATSQDSMNKPPSALAEARDEKTAKKGLIWPVDGDPHELEGKATKKRPLRGDQEVKEGSYAKEKKRVARAGADKLGAADGAKRRKRAPDAPVPDARKPGKLLDDGASPPPSAPGLKAPGSPGSPKRSGARTKAGKGTGEAEAEGSDSELRAPPGKGRGRGRFSGDPAEEKEDAIAPDAGEGLRLKKARESRKGKAKDDGVTIPSRGDPRDEALRRPPRMAGVALATFEVDEARATRAREALAQFILGAKVPAKPWSARPRGDRDVPDPVRKSERPSSESGKEVSLELRLTSEQATALRSLLGRHGKLTVAPSPETVPARAHDEESARARLRIFAGLARGAPGTSAGDSVGFVGHRKRAKDAVRSTPRNVRPGEPKPELKEAPDAPRAPAPRTAAGEEKRPEEVGPGPQSKKGERETDRRGAARREQAGERSAEPAGRPDGERDAKEAPSAVPQPSGSGKESGKKKGSARALFGRGTAEEAKTRRSLAAGAQKAPDVHYWLLVIRTR